MQTVYNTYWDAGKGNLTAQNTRKPFGGRGSTPDPAGGTYSAPANPLAGGRDWQPPPQEPHPRSRPFGPRHSYPTPKLVPTPLITHVEEERVSRKSATPIANLIGQGPVVQKNRDLRAHAVWETIARFFTVIKKILQDRTRVLTRDLFAVANLFCYSSNHWQVI